MNVSLFMVNAYNFSVSLPGQLIVSTSISEMGTVRSEQVASTRYYLYVIAILKLVLVSCYL